MLSNDIHTYRDLEYRPLQKSRDRAQNGRHRASASRPDQLSNAVAPDGSLQTPESKWLGPGQGTFLRLHSFNHHPSGIEPLGRNQSGTTPIEVILLHTQQMRAASLPHCLTQSHNITATVLEKVYSSEPCSNNNRDL